MTRKFFYKQFFFTKKSIDQSKSNILSFVVYFIICSYAEEISLYSTISSSYQSISSTMGNTIFIFVRWSHHFASFYTTPFLPNISSYASSLFPILHLLPMDTNAGNLNDIVSNYQQQIINTSPNITFSDDVSLFVSRNFIFGLSFF
jgi:hypothetical protein